MVSLSDTMIIGPIFFSGGINSHYGAHVLTPFSEYLSNYDSTHDFQQDSATADSKQFYALMIGCFW